MDTHGDVLSGTDVLSLAGGYTRPTPVNRWTPRFSLFKALVDLVMSLAALPVILAIALVLLVVNPVVNPGPVFFRQDRMGLGGRRIRLWKFRTMRPVPVAVRAHDARLEEDRITRLGRIMRRTRVDEIPNFINVLKGEMSVVGPRPDAWDHSVRYIDEYPFYYQRFRVRPGITGLAQVMGGYADTPVAIRRKVKWDHLYVRRARMRLDLLIMLRTLAVMLGGFGAK